MNFIIIVIVSIEIIYTVAKPARWVSWSFLIYYKCAEK